MPVWGISANEHDASLSVVDGSEILFAAHAERYSRVKNDAHLHPDLIAAARRWGEPEQIVWYERPLLKRARKFYAGQHDHVWRVDGAAYLSAYGLKVPVRYVGHHRSHAAAGFFTSPFDHAAILVVDAIGEWSTISAWEGRGQSLKQLWGQRYPHSLGLLYSAFTQRIGFKPNEEEYILMGAAALGKPRYVDLIDQDFVRERSAPNFRLKANVHRGVRWWRPEITDNWGIAASIQAITEEYLVGLARWLASRVRSPNLVLMGGLALNCVANTKIARDGAFDRIWIMPNPGDAGSSLGAVAAFTRKRLNWSHPYLGENIDRPFPHAEVTAALLNGEVVGIANGRAEFGPRALGNRSLIADPRGPEIKDRVNRIKKREPFRPFAPVIMAEFADRYFDMPVAESPYMQFVAPVKRPDLFPAIAHYDNTARVQTVRRAQHPLLYDLLSSFHEKTGCPMLLNTSLNIKGEPLVNVWEDARRFQALHNVKIF
jgi:carbamoyltransferase